MAKVQIAMPDTIRNEFLSWLQEQELLHVVEPKGENTHDIAPTTTSYELAQVQYAIEFIERIKSELKLDRKRWWQTLVPRPVLATLTELETTLYQLDIPTLLADIKTTSEALAEAAAQRHDLETKIATHEPWQTLTLTSRQLETSSTVRHALLILGAQEEEHFKGLIEQLPLAAWQIVRRVSEENKGLLYLEVVVDPSNSKQLDAIIDSTQAQVITLDLTNGFSVTEQLAAWKEQVQSLQEVYKKLLTTAKEHAAHERNLKYAYDALLNREAREKLETSITKLKFVSLISGWIPVDRLRTMKPIIEKKFPGVSIEEVTAETGEQPPVLLQNKRYLQPFEAVTNVYGKPLYTELDPSNLLALFFLIAFGFALTDAGYGLLIMLATGLALWRVPIKKETRKMVWLMFYAGFITVILGGLTGGWFGLVLEELPASSVRDFLLYIKLIDPVTEPIKLLAIALIIGVVQILFATAIKAYLNIRDGHYAAALLDNVAWMSLLLSILTWFAMGQGWIEATLIKYALWWIYASAAVMILFSGRAQKNIFLRLGTGVLSLYGLLSFLGDVLSYSRLLALGLATGIIGLVVNLIGGMVYDMVPVVGFLLAGIILIVGHIANLAINTLGAFIHGSRLQFVEFFPKFMEGGGAAFKPFGRLTKYIHNPREYEN